MQFRRMLELILGALLVIFVLLWRQHPARRAGAFPSALGILLKRGRSLLDAAQADARVLNERAFPFGLVALFETHGALLALILEAALSKDDIGVGGG